MTDAVRGKKKDRQRDQQPGEISISETHSAARDQETQGPDVGFLCLNET
jgi:hypothetical protein